MAYSKKGWTRAGDVVIRVECPECEKPISPKRKNVIGHMLKMHPELSDEDRERNLETVKTEGRGKRIDISIKARRMLYGPNLRIAEEKQQEARAESTLATLQ